MKPARGRAATGPPNRSRPSGPPSRRPARATPLVSVLMPTYGQATFIRRALTSLLAQTFHDWELVVVDDGSIDDTAEVLREYASEPRVRVHRLEQNRGLGEALNVAVGLARGRYLAYLPSDDVYDRDHLERLVRVLERDRGVYLAYAGLRWSALMYPPGYPRAGPGAYTPEDTEKSGPTLHGRRAVGREREVLEELRGAPGVSEAMPTGVLAGANRARQAAGLAPRRALPNNLLKLVQVMHRRRLERDVRWPTRAERESDTLEPDFWRALLARRARFRYAGRVTCAWVCHLDQRHHIILNRFAGGLSYYRQHYNLEAGQWVNWQPSWGPCVDERARYARLARARGAPPGRGLKILLVGDLGENPDRVLAFEQAGHELLGLWAPRPAPHTQTGPLPFGQLRTIRYDRRGLWRAAVASASPDIIYALLNAEAVPFLEEVIGAGLDAPVVFHFKNDPVSARHAGWWPALMRVIARSAGVIFSSEDEREWFRLATDGRTERKPLLVLDGELPKREWLSGRRSPKLSAGDGVPHLASLGPALPVPAERLGAALEALGAHLHVYGGVAPARPPGRLHVHPALNPSEWRRELSRYDAAWLPAASWDNRGDLRRALGPELTVPAEVYAYAFAGLPVAIMSRPGRRSVDGWARDLGVGIFYEGLDDLAARLRDPGALRRLGANARRAAPSLCFDEQVEGLAGFFRRAIARHREAPAPDDAWAPFADDPGGRRPEALSPCGELAFPIEADGAV